jgi:hypothetical protein
VLSWPIVVKLIPALPVAFLVLQNWAALARVRWPWSLGRAASVTLGLALGVFLFTLAIPAACIGWSQNLHHLRTWSRKVAANPDMAREARVEVDNNSNQSFSNAAHLFAARVRGWATNGTNSTTNQAAPEHWLVSVMATAERRRADRVTHRAVQGLQAIVLTLLMVVGLARGTRGNPLGQAATYGLACLATILISPVAWSHYYVLWLPSVLFVPLWLVRRSHLRVASAVATIPVGLIWVHYLAKPWIGQFGLLGLGTLVWFLAVVTLLIRLPSAIPTDACASSPARKRSVSALSSRASKIRIDMNSCSPPRRWVRADAGDPLRR